MNPEIWEHVGGQAYVIIDYLKEQNTPLNFYVAFYEYQRKAGDFVHSPRLCLPGAGWFIEESHVRTLSRSGEESDVCQDLRLNELVISKGGVRQLAYFWYQGRNRNFTNEFAAKFYMVWDGIFRRRTDGALVRLVMPITSENALKDTRQTMDRFALAASEELENYLP
jgi:EpsI family protein